MADYEIESLLTEERRFPPSPGVAADSVAQPELYAQAKADPVAFWGDRAREYVTWTKPFTTEQTLDWSGAPVARWFADGELNVAANCLDRHVEAGLGDRIAIRWEGEPGDVRMITYAELTADVKRAANALADLGIAKGDRVAIYLPLIPEAVVAMLAVARLGAVHSVVFGGFSAQSLHDRILDAGAKVVITADGGYRKGKVFALKPAVDEALDMLGEASTVERVLVVRRGENDIAWHPARDQWWHDALRDAAEEHDAQGFEAENPLFILYTSGTTGRPKGAVLPHHHFALRAHSLVQGLGYRRDDKLLHTLPLYHAHGLFMTTHCVLCSGASILLLPRFDPAEVVKHLPRVTMFSGVPTMYKRLLGTPMLGENSRAMRLFIVGSAALPPDVFARFEEQTGQRIVECWGMTETMTNCANPIAGLRKPGSAGKPLPGVQVYAAGPDGQPLPPGQPGALTLKATTRFSGYWRRPEAEQPRYRDGFFTTGDIGYIDEDGYLIIVGRNSDVIISGGFNVYPREVELALEQMEGVGRAAVFGLPHPDFGEAVTAAVEYHGSAPLQVAELQAKLKLCLASYKVPKAVFPVAHLPLTELGKIQRRVLVEQFKDHYASAG